MNGVTILSEAFCRGAKLSQVIAGLCGLVVMSLVIIPSTTDLWREKGRWIIKGILSILGLFVVSMFSLIAIGVCNEYLTFHTEYEVIVDDSVGFNEFYNHYEIIYRDGDIYTVREKDE